MERGILPLTLVIVSLSFLVLFVDSALEGRDNRRIGASTKLGCSYGDVQYQHGDPVQTPEPCLNCTCTRGVLVCYLRVCPTLVPPSTDCFAVKEADDCCATMICNSIHRSKINESSVLENHFHGRTLTNTMHLYKKPEIVHITNNHRSPMRFPDVSTTVESSTSGSTPQNVTSSQSLLLVSSTPTPLAKDFDILLNSITGCYVNDTIYAEGSAMISSSFCEYCYCIRGKQMCVRPKCHLSIEGCSPRYFSQYTCCPTRYMCNEKRKIYRLTSTPTSTSTEFTITTSSPLDLFTSPKTQSSGCSVEGIQYAAGDPIPSTAHCQTCYCSSNGIVCTSVTCSPAMEGCEPVIPEGHCCPLEFKCNFTQTPPSDIQETTIEMNGENSSEPSEAANATFPSSSVSSSNKTAEEVKEMRRTTHSLEPKTVIDPLALSPALMRENDRLIYFPEFAGNLRRRISEMASLVGYTTKHTNKGPFHSFRPPVIYKRNNERMTYFSKQGQGLIPRRAEGRGRSEFGPQDKAVAETGSEIVAASAKLHIAKTRQPTVDVSPAENATIPVESSSLKSDDSEDFSQVSTDENPVDALKPVPKEDITMASLEDTTFAITSDLSAEFSTLKTSSSSLPSQQSSILDHSITTVITAGDYNSDISTTTGAKPREDSVQATTAAEAPSNEETSTISPLSQYSTQKAIHFTTEEISVSTDSSTSYTSTEHPLLRKTSIMLMETDVESSENGTSVQSITHSNSDTKLPKDNQQTLQDDYLLHTTLSEDSSIITASVDDLNKANASTSEASKEIWYSDPGITTVTSPEDNVSASPKLDNKKRPRQKEGKPHFQNNIPIIPFLAKDAITARPYSRPIRNRTTTLPSVEVIVGHCVINSRVYINGEMIASSDPCSLCRCFYGKALCQKQQCPPPPTLDCSPEHSADVCCPHYVCGKGGVPTPSSSTPAVPLTELHWQTLSSQAPSQLALQTEEDVNTHTTISVIATSSSQYADSALEEQNAKQNSKHSSTLDVIGSTPSTDQAIIPVTATRQSKVTDSMTEENLSPTVSAERFPEKIKSEFWALLRVSGCNIYGQYYQLGERVGKLSDECKDCICTKDGVKCNNFC